MNNFESTRKRVYIGGPIGYAQFGIPPNLDYYHITTNGNSEPEPDGKNRIRKVTVFYDHHVTIGPFGEAAKSETRDCAHRICEMLQKRKDPILVLVESNEEDNGDPLPPNTSGEIPPTTTSGDPQTISSAGIPSIKTAYATVPALHFIAKDLMENAPKLSSTAQKARFLQLMTKDNIVNRYKQKKLSEEKTGECYSEDKNSGKNIALEKIEVKSIENRQKMLFFDRLCANNENPIWIGESTGKTFRW